MDGPTERSVVVFLVSVTGPVVQGRLVDGNAHGAADHPGADAATASAASGIEVPVLKQPAGTVEQERHLAEAIRVGAFSGTFHRTLGTTTGNSSLSRVFCTFSTFTDANSASCRVNFGAGNVYWQCVARR